MLINNWANINNDFAHTTSQNEVQTLIELSLKVIDGSIELTDLADEESNNVSIVKQIANNPIQNITPKTLLINELDYFFYNKIYVALLHPPTPPPPEDCIFI